MIAAALLAACGGSKHPVAPQPAAATISVPNGAAGQPAKAPSPSADGIGDQAIAVGPALMIKTGDDLVKLIFTGVDDAPVKAKKIFDTAKARM